MNLRLRDRAEMAIAGAGTTKALTAMTICAAVSTVLFIIALAVGFGVGFGIGGRTPNTIPVTLSPPIVPCSTLTATCGCAANKPDFTPRIVNGQIAAPNSWPWMVYLSSLMYRTYCTGFIISQQHVVTSANCVYGWGPNVTINVGINNFQSYFGGINASNSNATTITYYPGDIAVVTLALNLTFGATLQPCCLTKDPSAPQLNVHGVIAGWGETAGNTLGVVSPTLRQAVVQVVDPLNCNLPSTNTTPICAAFDNVAACPIDAGGPLMINVNNAWTCVGVITRQSTCQNPITFTRISQFLPMLYNATLPDILYFQRK